MKFKSLALAALTAGLVGIGSSAQAAIVSDIIMIVDESGSMGTVQNNLRTNIGAFATILQAGGVDVRFGLVGYGASSTPGLIRKVTDLTDATGFATAASGLVASGGTEPGYTASAFALNGLDGQSSLFSFRPNSLKNLIIFTDEPSNGDASSIYKLGGSSVTSTSLDTLLTQENALYNAVLKGVITTNSYSTLTAAHNGQVFDLNGLNTTDQTVVSNFVTAFATAKLQETIDFCTANPNAAQCQGSTVPEPSVLALLGIGLFGIGVARRKA